MPENLKISVIIPTKNRADQVEFCLKAFSQQTLDPDKFEILIVDDGSKDNTKEVLENAKKQFSRINISFAETKRYEDNFRAAKARNFGAKRAKYPILLFIDSDIIPDPHMLENHLKYYRKYKNITVMGYRFNISFPFQYIAKDLVENKKIKELFYVPLEYDIREPAYSIDRIPNGLLRDEHIPWRHYHSHNISVLKKDFDAVKGFDEKFVGWGDEDLELGYRLWKRGLRFVFDRDIIGFHLDHYANKKKKLISEYDNKRYSLEKHQDLEMDLFNDDTNPSFWTKKELPYFKYLQKQPYISQEVGEPEIPLQILKSADCVIGEGAQLKKFKNIKHLINFRNEISIKPKSGTKQYKLIGNMLPFKDQSLKTVVIYNYLDLLPEFYVMKIISEALRCGRLVYVFHPRIDDFIGMIRSFASRKIEVIGQSSSGREYVKLINTPKVKSVHVPINIFLSTFEELNYNPNLLGLAIFLEKSGYEVNFFSSQFNYRYAFESASYNFKAYAGFIYDNMWEYFNVEDKDCINIHIGANHRWNYGANAVILDDSFVFYSNNIENDIAEINSRCDNVFLLRNTLSSQLVEKGLKIKTQDLSWLHPSSSFDFSVKAPQFFYFLKGWGEDSVKNLCVWLEAFIRFNKQVQNSLFIVTFKKNFGRLFLDVDLFGFNKSPIWGEYIGNIEKFNTIEKDKAHGTSKALEKIIEIYQKEIMSPPRQNSSRSKISMSRATQNPFSFNIDFEVGNEGRNIENKNDITDDQAYSHLFAKTNSQKNEVDMIDQLLSTIGSMEKHVSEDRTRMKNIWGFLEEDNFTRFLSAQAELREFECDNEKKLAKAISYVLKDEIGQAKSLFDLIQSDAMRMGKDLKEIYYSWRGYMKLLSGERQEAIESFENCLEINPKNLMSILNVDYIRKEKSAN